MAIIAKVARGWLSVGFSSLRGNILYDYCPELRLWGCTTKLVLPSRNHNSGQIQKSSPGFTNTIMSLLLNLSKLTHREGEKILFSDLDLSVSAGDRVALVGHNGSGKSTLLDIIAGKRKADSGSISYKRQLNLCRVEQFVDSELAKSPVLEAVCERLPDPGEHWKAEALLSVMQFSQTQLAINVGDLSGGQQNKVMFCRAVISEPELLLLDEPTNHMDLETLLSFEVYLSQFRGAFVLVSHDREFLDRMTSHTCILRDQRLYAFNLNFSEARDALHQMDDAARHTREVQEKKIDSLRSSAKRLATWGQVYDNETFSRRAKSMEKRIDKLDAQKTFVTAGSGLDLKVDLEQTRSRQILRVENFHVCIPRVNRCLFEVEDFLIRPGDRIALLGRNGTGKSTFIKQLNEVFRGEDSFVKEGAIGFSPQTSLGYYDQELNEVSDVVSIEDFVNRRVTQNNHEIRGELIAAGFPYSKHSQSVASLSGGERARILFAVLSMRKPNFLILDEPTNHLDIEGKEQLEDQLKHSGAALLITSHDRRFISNVAQRFVWINEGKLVECTSAEPFYAALTAEVTNETLDVSVSEKQSLDAGIDFSGDALLERLLVLETRLEEDLERKARFQKPDRQQLWRDEISDLYARMDKLSS